MTSTSQEHMEAGDQGHQLQLFNEKTQAASCTSLSSHVLAYSCIQDQGSSHPRQANQLNYQEETNDFGSKGGSLNNQGLNLCRQQNEEKQSQYQCRQTVPIEWLPSKLRLVRTMMSTEWAAMEAPAHPQIKYEEYHKQGSSSPSIITKHSSNSSSTIPVRVCSNCNTTKTPLWRSGPRGPKSLCNACGIRQRKARRALAAAVAAANGTPTAAATRNATPLKPRVQKKDNKMTGKTQTATCKKRSQLGHNNGSKKQLSLEDFLISLSQNLASHRVFPQDEKEAAILLMALSYGLVHGSKAFNT